MSWYDPTSWDYKRIGTGLLTGGLSELGLGDDSAQQQQQRAQLMGQGDIAAQNARQAWLDYRNAQGRGWDQLVGLQNQAAGKNSLSAEQLRQGLQQNLAAQQSMAAGASPRNQAMAARTALMQQGRLGAGLAGQQATAGIQERQAAAQQYNAMLGQMMGNALNAYGTNMGNALQAYGGYKPEGSFIDKYGPMIQGGVTAAATAAKSDRRAKTDIEPGDAIANDAMRKLPAFAYRYKDERDGAGTQLGPMAQDLEKAGLKHAVIDTPSGKYVDTRKLSLANTAMVTALARRLDAMEGGGK